MAKSFNLEVQKKPNSKGMFPVYIRITENRKHKRIKTSIELRRFSDWNPKAKDDKHIRQSEPNYAKWNQILADELEEIKGINRDDSNSSIEALKQTYQNKGVTGSFLEFAKTKVEESRPLIAISTHKHFISLINKLVSYLESQGKHDICFNEVNISFIKGFESYLSKIENERVEGRTLERSTIVRFLKNLRKLVNDAVKEDYISVNDNPFMKFTIKRGAEPKKEKLEMEELDTINGLELEKDSLIWHVRNAFMFSYYNAGIRAGDLLQLRWSNVVDGRLCYQMGKNGKNRSYEIIPEAQQILDQYKSSDNKLDDYIFPFLDSNSEWAKKSIDKQAKMAIDLRKKLDGQISSKNVILNKYLRKIAVLAGIDKPLTMHISRHSFAYQAMKKNVPSKIIQGLLGHYSIKTTEVYMGNFSNEESDKALEQVFSKNQREKANDIISALMDADTDTIEKVKQLLSIK